MKLCPFANDGGALHLSFHSSIAVGLIHILIDTGASHNLAETTFATDNKLLIKTKVGKASCGDQQTTASTFSSIHTWISI